MNYNTYTIKDIEQVKDLFVNHGPLQISKITGIPRGTINYWKTNEFNPTILNKVKTSITNCPEYSFILGFYLGDGHIIKNGRTQRLSLFNDMKYENINLHIEKCLSIIFPENKVHRIKKIGSYQITVHNNSIPEMFPQHGVGKKHDRVIQLERWQKDIVEKYPKDFIKGLIYSDGCIVYSNQYKRFEFSNRSEDIHNILTYALQLIGVEKTSTRRKSKNVENEQYNQFVTTISKIPYIDMLSDFIP